MDRGVLLVLLVAALVVFVSPAVRATAHLSFSNNTEVNITRAGCGVTKLCVETPDDCDPAGNSTSCLFGSVAASAPTAPHGTELAVQLRGDSSGYVALGLTMNASEGSTKLFICAQNSSDNGSFFFRTMDRNNSNNDLTASETRTTEIRGSVTGNVIRCEFNVPNVNSSSARSQDTSFTVLLGTGALDGNVLGAFNTSLNSGFLNLADPMSNVPTTAAPTAAPTAPDANTTTAAATTASGGGGVQPPAVLLLLLSVLSLSVLLRA